MLDTVVVLSRLGRVGGWTPAASLQTIGAIIERPRTFYVIETGSANGVGTPAFTTGGKVVGLLTMRSVQSGRPGMFSMVGGSEGVGLLPVILPAADVRDIAQQAPEKQYDHPRGWRIVRWSPPPPAPRWSLAIAAAAGSRTSTLRRLVIDTLAERLDSEAPCPLQRRSVPHGHGARRRAERPAARPRRSAAAAEDSQLRHQRRSVWSAEPSAKVPRALRSDGLEINIPPGGPDFKEHYSRAADPNAPRSAVVVANPHRAARIGGCHSPPHPEARREGTARVPDPQAADGGRRHRAACRSAPS